MRRESLKEISQFALWMRGAKVAALRARRLAEWAVRPDQYPILEMVGRDGFAHEHWRESIAIARCDAGADPRLEAGKRVNVALAAPCFDGLAVAPDRPLSFWRTLGRPTRARGFRHGMELRGGCVMPTIGGGLCLISNLLFRAACRAGWTIIERHGHTMDAAPAGNAPWGMDATVFWPFVDLRIAPRAGEARLGMAVRGNRLEIEIRSTMARATSAVIRETARRDTAGVRENRLVRDLISLEDGSCVATETVASNHKRLLEVVERRRNCLTCNESECRARPLDLAEIAR